METTEEPFGRGIPSVPNEQTHVTQFTFGAGSVTFLRKKHTEVKKNKVSHDPGDFQEREFKAGPLRNVF